METIKKYNRKCFLVCTTCIHRTALGYSCEKYGIPDYMDKCIDYKAKKEPGWIRLMKRFNNLINT